jgi:DNA-binding MarR family transcriptional regulator
VKASIWQKLLHGRRILLVIWRSLVGFLPKGEIDLATGKATRVRLDRLGIVSEFDRETRPRSRRGTANFDPVHWLPHQFSFIANRVSMMLARMYSERFGITVVGWRMIAVLGRHAPLSAKELADRTAMDQVSVTRALAQLLALGLVSRGTDPADRRKAVLRLTKQGKAAYDEVVPLAHAIGEALTEKLAAADRRVLRRTMNALVGRAAIILDEKRDWRTLVAPRGKRAK